MHSFRIVIREQRGLIGHPLAKTILEDCPHRRPDGDIRFQHRSTCQPVIRQNIPCQPVTPGRFRLTAQIQRTAFKKLLRKPVEISRLAFQKLDFNFRERLLLPP